MVIDSHHHFWKYDQVQYPWIDDEKEVLKRDFLPQDLLSVTIDSGVSGVISVQARQVVEETRWLLKIANGNNFIKGIVGWIPLCDKSVEEQLDDFKDERKLLGVRHVVQDEANPDFLMGKSFNHGVSFLKNYNLVYDILVFESQLSKVVEFVKMHPYQVFVLDHIAKPKIIENLMSPWEKYIRILGSFDNVYCKLSGMVTEADFANWNYQQLKPYFDVCVEAFGTKRLMFGSDWPVCLLASDYGNWLDIVKRFFADFSKHEKEDVFYKSAKRAYNLSL